MKNTEFYSREELLTMPLVAIRGLDIDTPEQETLIQEIVNIKLASLPVQRPIYRNDVPDISTPEEEARWQDIMDRRTRLVRGEKLEEAPVEIPSSEPALEPLAPEFNPESQPLAVPTGEGDPVTFGGEVNVALSDLSKQSMASIQTASPVKPSKKTKVK